MKNYLLLGKKMTKKIFPYLAIFLLMFYIIKIKVNFNSLFNNIKKSNEKNSIEIVELREMKKNIEFEERMKGKELVKISVLDKNKQKKILRNVLKKKLNDYGLIILSSFESCSSCRDQTLKIWNDLFKKIRNYLCSFYSQRRDL